MTTALRIAIVGAESTGKTVLAQALAQRLRASTGLRCGWVGEWLRVWCEREGRTPQPHEQAAIARQQHALIDAGAAGHDVLVCDTTALMTAVYSDLLFGDRSPTVCSATARMCARRSIAWCVDCSTSTGCPGSGWPAQGRRGWHRRSMQWRHCCATRPRCSADETGATPTTRPARAASHDPGPCPPPLGAPSPTKGSARVASISRVAGSACDDAGPA